MKKNEIILRDKNIKIYKNKEEALKSKHDLAIKFIEKVGIEKIAALGK